MTLKERRKEKGLMQREVAEKLNVMQGSVSAWELGRAIPCRKHRKMLAVLYGCTVDEIAPGKA